MWFNNQVFSGRPSAYFSARFLQFTLFDYHAITGYACRVFLWTPAGSLGSRNGDLPLQRVTTLVEA